MSSENIGDLGDLLHQVPNHVAVNVREAAIDAVVPHGQFRVVDAE